MASEFSPNQKSYIRLGDYLIFETISGNKTYHRIEDVNVYGDSVVTLTTNAFYLNDQITIRFDPSREFTITDNPREKCMSNDIVSITTFNEDHLSSDKVFLTGIEDIDFNILLNLDTQSLNNVCNTDTNTKKLCSNPRFVTALFERDLPGITEFIQNIPLSLHVYQVFMKSLSDENKKSYQDIDKASLENLIYRVMVDSFYKYDGYSIRVILNSFPKYYSIRHIYDTFYTIVSGSSSVHKLDLLMELFPDFSRKRIYNSVVGDRKHNLVKHIEENYSDYVF